MMQASPEYRLDEQALNNMFVRNGTEMAPVSQFVTLKQVLGPETANRFNLYSTITANVNPADGYSSGEVQKVIEEVAAESLPMGYGYEYGGMAREEASSGGAHLRHLYLPDLSDSGLSLRKFPRTVCRYLLRTVRIDGLVPVRQDTRTGE